MNTTEIKNLYDLTLDKVRSDFSEQSTMFEAAIRFLDLLDQTYKQQILNCRCSRKSFYDSIRSKKDFSICVNILGVSMSLATKMSISTSLCSNEDTGYINPTELRRDVSNLLWSATIPLILAKNGIFNSEASNIKIISSNCEILTEHTLSLYSIDTNSILPLLTGNIIKIQQNETVTYCKMYHELIEQLPINNVLMILFSPTSSVPLKEALTFYPDMMLHKKECLLALMSTYDCIRNTQPYPNKEDLVAAFKPLLEFLFKPDALKPAYMAWELSSDIQTFVDTLQEYIEIPVYTELPELY